MNQVTINFPRHLVFGPDSISKMAEEIPVTGISRLYILTIPALMDQLLPVLDSVKSHNIQVRIDFSIQVEPSYHDLKRILDAAAEFHADAVAGIGGGSIMDVAKLVAALLGNEQTLKDITGKNLLKSRKHYLICVPTTSGTGSEMSPNALLTDPVDGSKQAVISPFLVPDAVYIDPLLTLGLPPKETAYTGMDAFAHCLEAYTNKNAHPLTDVYALEGIRLVAHNLHKAVHHGENLEARTNMAQASMYGGMCLGPVNTTAVHAMAYPLSTQFKISHGLSVAVLLPYVLEYNCQANPGRFAEIARAVGAREGDTEMKTALQGIDRIRQLMKSCHIPDGLSSLGIPEDSLESMASSATGIQRLLNNNIRKVSFEDAVAIYKSSY